MFLHVVSCLQITGPGGRLRALKVLWSLGFFVMLSVNAFLLVWTVDDFVTFSNGLRCIAVWTICSVTFWVFPCHHGVIYNLEYGPEIPTLSFQWNCSPGAYTPPFRFGCSGLMTTWGLFACTVVSFMRLHHKRPRCTTAQAQCWSKTLFTRSCIVEGSKRSKLAIPNVSTSLPPVLGAWPSWVHLVKFCTLSSSALQMD